MFASMECEFLIVPILLMNTPQCCLCAGTTGRPKGVTISHNAIVVQSLAKLAVVGYSSSDVSLIVPCIFHS